MNAPVLRFHQVSKLYKSGSMNVSALSKVDLTVESGLFAAVVGPSGSGKTTLLNLAGCLDTPTEGSVEIDGERVESMSDRELTALRRQRIGFVFQDFNLIQVLTAAENIEYPLILSGLPARERRQRVADILEIVGISELASKRPSQLSGGEQQRVAVCRGLVGRPKLVLADEPTGNLDSENGIALISTMIGLNRKLGTTFIFSTHDPEIMSYADRIISLRDGKITA